MEIKIGQRIELEIYRGWLFVRLGRTERLWERLTSADGSRRWAYTSQRVTSPGRVDCGS
jgi:hypothetical protein